MVRAKTGVARRINETESHAHLTFDTLPWLRS